VRAQLTTLLTLLQRWQASTHVDGPAEPSSPDVELLRGFVRLLEAEYAHHHAAVLTRLTGHSTKRMVTDRVMTEVTRLLRFTDLTVQQVAARVGYDDPLYLSRAFKSHTGHSPSAWRELQRG
jgi:methylphosphotriester-DNA--protein-cysteine methyltransferase